MKEQYLEQQKHTEDLILEKAKLLAKELAESEDPGIIWRFLDSAAIEIGVLEVKASRLDHSVEIIRQKPWARVRLVGEPDRYRNRRGSREATFHVVEMEPRYMAEIITNDPVIRRALLRIVDDGEIAGSARHFGGQATVMQEGKPLVVTVYTD